MRHVFVFIEVLGAEGGIQSYIQDVLSAYASLPKAEADVFLLRDSQAAPNPLRHCRQLRFHYFKSTRPMLGRVRLTVALMSCLMRYRPEHVFCGHINLAVMVNRLCRWLKLPYTVLTYGKEVWDPLPPAEQAALAAAERFWTISRYSRDLACQANQIDPGQARLLPCVVDGRQFMPGTAPDALVAQYSLKESLVLMTVARLWSGDPYKGVDMTIRALPQILQVFSNVKYLVIGRGDDQPRLAQLAEDLGVAERVIFAGFVPTAALADHYRLADVYVMPSREGFGIVYLEAMACGVPVISGDSDGSAEPLQDGRLGWQVSYRDADAIAQACIEALKGEDSRCQGDWLRQETLNRFSASALAARLTELLSETD
ncbi:glycosyltransferase family 4 protein [Romeria aff. gracilis LEGE 07310]|uniref:Glycosyltransferase family 4 protein n=1 Tax=Vasconcelosia minhoensis LEGE 07310 TaxID=915328 RepID=A0A8J7DMW9_9CYAN|nr:glycosyltransferase family 4 protein [Romeria gracilis]MBE9079491.1 glycosyltransferase family 4 protein [Romeria aff. gracilis LEGE 07310]